MLRYSEFKPTAFDSKGLACPNRQDWFVGLTQNRDSGIVEESNFAVALACLTAIDKRVETASFGHWACGWIEVMLCPPDNPALTAELEAIQASLSDYPILCDTDHSEREQEAASEYWSSMTIGERVQHLRENTYTPNNFSQLLQAVRGCWGAAGDMLHDPSELLY